MVLAATNLNSFHFMNNFDCRLIIYNFPSLSDPADITSDQTMVTRARRHQNDGDEDKAASAIASGVLRILVTAVTKAITTANANTTVPVTFTPNTISYSSAIDRMTASCSRQIQRKGSIGGTSSLRPPKGGKMMEFPPPLSTPTRYWTSSRIIQSSSDWAIS